MGVHVFMIVSKDEPRRRTFHPRKCHLYKLVLRRLMCHCFYIWNARIIHDARDSKTRTASLESVLDSFTQLAPCLNPKTLTGLAFAASTCS